MAPTGQAAALMTKWQIMFCGLVAYLGSMLFLRLVGLEILRNRRLLEAIRNQKEERLRRDSQMVVGTANAVLTHKPAEARPRYD